jgi:U3 small nucleolar RNA-associated protein 14
LNKGVKLSLDDLLAPLSAQPPSSSLLSFKQSTKLLATTSSKIQTLAAPLPHRTQERLDREAAYEQTREEVGKWGATMKRIKEVSFRFYSDFFFLIVFDGRDRRSI